jgi:hypothetical protein
MPLLLPELLLAEDAEPPEEVAPPEELAPELPVLELELEPAAEELPELEVAPEELLELAPALEPPLFDPEEPDALAPELPPLALLLVTPPDAPPDDPGSISLDPVLGEEHATGSGTNARTANLTHGEPRTGDLEGGVMVVKCVRSTRVAQQSCRRPPRRDHARRRSRRRSSPFASQRPRPNPSCSERTASSVYFAATRHETLISLVAMA